MRASVTRSARKNCKVSNKRRATLYAFIFAMNFYLRNTGESLSFHLLEEIEKDEIVIELMRKNDLTLANKIIDYNNYNS